MDQIILLIAARLGIAPALLPLYLGVIVAVANLVGKQIPSSAVGPLGILRKVCLVVGLYVPQKITAGISTKNVAEAIAATVPDSIIKDAGDSLPSAVKIGTDFGNMAATLVSKAEGKEPGHAYVPGESPEPGSDVPDQYRTDGPFAAGKDKFQ